jgi:hypothetical protein
MELRHVGGKLSGSLALNVECGNTKLFVRLGVSEEENRLGTRDGMRHWTPAITLQGMTMSERLILIHQKGSGHAAQLCIDSIDRHAPCLWPFSHQMQVTRGAAGVLPHVSVVQLSCRRRIELARVRATTCVLAIGQLDDGNLSVIVHAAGMSCSIYPTSKGFDQSSLLELRYWPATEVSCWGLASLGKEACCQRTQMQPQTIVSG